MKETIHNEYKKAKKEYPTKTKMAEYLKGEITNNTIK